MGTFTIIILTILVMAFIFFIIMMIFPKGSAKDINIHLDENSKVRLSRSDEGIRLDLVYDEAMLNPSISSILPDMVNDLMPDEDALDRRFWQKVNSFFELDAAERETVKEKLTRHNFVRMVELLEGEEKKERADNKKGRPEEPSDAAGNEPAKPSEPADAPAPTAQTPNASPTHGEDEIKIVKAPRYEEDPADFDPGVGASIEFEEEGNFPMEF